MIDQSHHPDDRVYSSDPDSFSDLAERGEAATREIVSVLRESERRMVDLEHRIQYLEQLVWTDVLTGLYNRRGLEEEVGREESRLRRYNLPAAVAVLQVEGLAAVRADHGSTSADALLRTVGMAVRMSARGTDIVARIGVDVFAALLPGADLPGAGSFVDRIRADAQFARLPDGAIVPVHLSTGTATWAEAGDLHSALELADQRLNESRVRPDGG